MRVRDICRRDPITVERGASLVDVAVLMRERHVGAVVVLDPGSATPRAPVGVVTDRDLVVEVLAKGLSVDAVAAGDVMSGRVVTVREDAETDEALSAMHAHAVRRLPVVDEAGDLVGLVSSDDLVGVVGREVAQLYALIVREIDREQTLRD